MDESLVDLKAIEVNGLNKDFLNSKKITKRSDAIKEFVTDANESEFLVAHNGKFDANFLIQMMKKENLEIPDFKKKIKDTMTSTVNLCKIPLQRGGFKYPRLSELAEFLKIDYSDLKLHDSMSDVELTSRCYIQLQSENKI